MKYQFWLFLGKIFDRKPLKELNRFVRLFYLKILTPTLELFFKRQIPHLKVIPRHSTKTGVRFNPFFSDLDLTILVPIDTSDFEILNLRNRYLQAKRLIPSLGEIEIFTFEDFKKYREIQSGASEFFDLIRSVRKLKWLQEDVRNAKTSYHLFKAQRSLRNYRLNYSFPIDLSNVLLAKNLGQMMNRLMQTMTTSGLNFDSKLLSDVQCNHLGWNTETELMMESETAWKILAILPSEALSKAAEGNLKTLRLQKDIRSIYLAYTEFEKIQIQAVYRANPEKFPWMKSWGEQLGERLQMALMEST